MSEIKIGCVSLIHGDFRDVTAQYKPQSVSAICTDPPYGRNALWLYPELTRMAGRLLEPGGDLVSIFPQYCVPDVAAWTEGSGCTWRWLIMMSQFDGPHPRLCNAHRNLEILSKSIGWWYVKGGEPNYANVRDAFVNKPKGKIEHEWQQSDSWAEYCCETFCTNRKQIVLDPMVGTGTLLVECLRRGIPAVGIDIDAEQIERATQRLLNVYAEIGDVQSPPLVEADL